MAAIAVLALALGVVVAGAGTAWADSKPHSITIKNTNSNISINGKTYTAYKLFDSTHSGDAYAYTLSTSSPFYSADLTTDLSGSESDSLSKVLRTYFTFTEVSGDSSRLNVAVKGTYSADTARSFADAVQTYLNQVDSDITQSTTLSSYKKTSGEAADETATITLENDSAGQGYYIVTGGADPKSGTGEVQSAVMVTNEDPDPVVNPKANVPSLDKKITSVSDAGGKTKDGAVLAGSKVATAGIGDIVHFELDSNVPDLTGYSSYTYQITDTLSEGLDFVKRESASQPTVSISIDNTALKADQYTVTVDQDNPQKMTVTVPYSILKSSTKGATIVVSYDATVNSNAVRHNYDNNTASLEYSNNPYDSSTNTTPESRTHVINVNINVNKVANSAQGDKLSGAKFKLYKGSDSKATDAWYHYEDGVVSWGAEANATEITTNGQGTFDKPFYGLGNGVFNLVETEAPTGYGMLANPVAVTISAASTSDADSSNGVTISADGAKVTNATIPINVEAKEEQPVATATVVNNSGSVLPSTGGAGTVAFYVVGGVLIAGAVAYLVHRRKANANA